MLRTSLMACALVVTSMSFAQAEDEPLTELGERYAAQQKRYDEAQQVAKTH